MRDRHGLGAFVLAGLALAACREREARPVAVEPRRPVPAADRGELCADLTGQRVCWGAPDAPRCERGMCLRKRPVPALPARSALGWRCTGRGESRRCVDRADLAGEFLCNGSTCVQRHPRLPDDGEWRCSATAGAVVCTGRDPPAGVVAAGHGPGWICGHRGDGQERLCVDLSPDFPDGRAAGWRCRYADERGVERVCERDPAAHALGDRCGDDSPCVDGARCVSGRCLPRRPTADCWVGADCPGGVCRFGSCVGEAP